MYLAPLNYDRFFKKVFSDKTIAQQFLEDFLETDIEEIEILKEKHRVTDDASIVEFDFRCKIDGAYIIIDMQQWYKVDVVKRFYLYHSLNTSLQLETLPAKQLVLDRTSKKIRKTKDYRYVEPVLTLIWMVDDNLGFDENYISYALSPEVSLQFIENEKLWANPELTDIIREQQKVLGILKNDTKGMHFLRNNKLIFLFQKNIVKNNLIEKYVRWFKFAEKTKNKNNQREDFEEYQEDSVFLEIINRITKQSFNDEENQYVQEQTEFWENYSNLTERLYTYGLNDGLEKGLEEGMEKGLEKGLEEGMEKGLEKGLEEGLEKGKEIEKIQIAIALLDILEIETIVQKTGLSIKTVQALKNKKGED